MTKMKLSDYMKLKLMLRDCISLLEDIIDEEVEL